MAEEDHKKSTPYTLGAFIEQHSKLLTAIGLFVALAAFSAHSNDYGIAFLLPGVALLGALVLTLELFLNVPREPSRSWRLLIFELVLLGILFNVGRYWFGTFQVIWIPALILLTLSVLVVGCFAFLLFIFRRIFVALLPRLKRRLTDTALQIIRTSGQFLCMGAGLALMWKLQQIAHDKWAIPTGIKSLLH